MNRVPAISAGRVRCALTQSQSEWMFAVMVKVLGCVDVCDSERVRAEARDVCLYARRRLRRFFWLYIKHTICYMFEVVGVCIGCK